MKIGGIVSDKKEILEVMKISMIGQRSKMLSKKVIK